MMNAGDIYHIEPGDILMSNWGNLIKVDDFNANKRDLEAEQNAYEFKKWLQEEFARNDEKVRAEVFADAPENRVMQQIKDICAKNSEITTRSAEKATKGRTPGQIGCPPENVIPKQDHAYANLEDSPDIGPDLVKRTGSVQQPQPRDNTLV